MDELTIYKWATFLLPTISTGITWILTRRTRENDMMRTMQESIDMLLEKNKELVREVTELREENIELRRQVDEVKNIMQRNRQMAGKRAKKIIGNKSNNQQ